MAHVIEKHCGLGSTDLLCPCMAVTINLNLSTTDVNSIKNPKEGFSPLEHLQISHRPLFWLHWDCPDKTC